MSAKKTAWHPPFTGLLQERAPRWAKVSGEVQLTTEPLRVDDVIEVWADREHDPSDVGTTLRGLWRYVVVVGLLEYKSVVWPFQHGDLYRLLAYGFVWIATHQKRERAADGARSERLAPHEVTLMLAVPSLTDVLREELDELGLALSASDTGYHEVHGALIPLVVVNLSVVAEREDDDLLRWFAGIPMRTLEGGQWVVQHQGKRGESMGTQATPDLFGYDEFVRQAMNNFTPEQRLAGLAPEQRLAGLAPEQRLAGLAPEQRLAGIAPEHLVLALPDDALRALSAEYIAALPADVQASVRARIAR
jgi:hypothetical protein